MIDLKQFHDKLRPICFSLLNQSMLFLKGATVTQKGCTFKSVNAYFNSCVTLASRSQYFIILCTLIRHIQLSFNHQLHTSAYAPGISPKIIKRDKMAIVDKNQVEKVKKEHNLT